MVAQYHLSLQGFLLRFAAAMAVVFASYNPSGYSYFHWARAILPEWTVLLIFVGVVLLIVWVIFLRATFRSLGIVGLLLAAAFFGTLFWLLVDYGLLDPSTQKTLLAYVILILAAALLTVGMSWSHVRRRISGQADVDEVDS